MPLIPTINVRDDTGNNEIYLTTVDQYSTAHDAAYDLWTSVHNASKIFGGKALLRTPKDGEHGYLVRWELGPKQWAGAYVVCDGADAPGFASSSESVDGMEVRFVDLD